MTSSKKNHEEENVVFLFYFVTLSVLFDSPVCVLIILKLWDLIRIYSLLVFVHSWSRFHDSLQLLFWCFDSFWCQSGSASVLFLCLSFSPDISSNLFCLSFPDSSGFVLSLDLLWFRVLFCLVFSVQFNFLFPLLVFSSCTCFQSVNCVPSCFNLLSFPCQLPVCCWFHARFQEKFRTDEDRKN